MYTYILEFLCLSVSWRIHTFLSLRTNKHRYIQMYSYYVRVCERDDPHVSTRMLGSCPLQEDMWWGTCIICTNWREEGVKKEETTRKPLFSISFAFHTCAYVCLSSAPVFCNCLDIYIGIYTFMYNYIRLYFYVDLLGVCATLSASVWRVKIFIARWSVRRKSSLLVISHVPPFETKK